MKKFEGQFIIRTKATHRNGGVDRSYMFTPTFVKKVEGNHAYVETVFGNTTELGLLPADYCDAENWEPCNQELAEVIIKQITKPKEQKP